MKEVNVDKVGPPGYLEDYVKHLNVFYNEMRGITEGIVLQAEILGVRDRCKAFIEKVVRDIYLLKPKIIGFSSHYEQINSSVALAGALKENNRAVIVGDRSFGKGSVQQLIELMDGSALKLTIAKYLTPLFTDIQSVGITPDIKLVPATVIKDNVNLFRGIAALREEDLKQHLDEHPKGETSFAALKYFLETKEKDKTEEPEEEVGDPYKLPDFNTDFHVLFAKKLLLNTVTPQREAFLQNSLPIIEETTRLEEEKIALALQKLDIDWSTGTGTGTSKSTVSYSTNPANGRGKAGEKMTLTMTVTNTGEASLYQLRGISSSKNGLFDKLEFILGRRDQRNRIQQR